MRTTQLHSLFSLTRLISQQGDTPLRVYAGMTVCLFSLLTMVPATALAWCGHRPYVLAACLAGVAISALGAGCLYFRRAYLPCMYAVLVSLGGVTLVLTANGGIVGNGSIIWTILLPPMCILGLGIRHGTYISLAAYLALLIMFTPPAADWLPFKYTLASRIWILLVMLAAGVFSWLSEYARYRVQLQLVEVVSHLEHFAFTDPLTLLGNRREFENAFIRENAMLLRKNRPFAIMMFDLDHFKAVNDRFGHNAGDAVLVHTSRVLRENLRVSDQLCRWGGEEFTALLPDTGLDEAVEIAERIRLAIQDTPCVYENQSISFTISAGVYLCADDLPLEKHIESVDALLYKAKNNGRNQIQAGGAAPGPGRDGN